MTYVYRTVGGDVLEQWLRRCDECGPIPSADACLELLTAGPDAGAERTPEYMLVSLIARWRKAGAEDESILRAATVYWDEIQT